MSIAAEIAVALCEDSDCVINVCVGCTPGFELTGFVDVLGFGAPRCGLLGGWVNDEAKAMCGVTRKNAFDFVARYVLGVSLDVDAWLGGIWREDSEDDRTGGTPDGFKEGPLRQGELLEHRG